jgi:hypothetical protein
MFSRITLLSLLAVPLAVIGSVCRADGDRRDYEDSTVVPNKDQVCVFELALSVEDASPEMVKKLMSPYRVLDIRVLHTNGLSVQYAVRISCPADKKGVAAKFFFHEDLPRNHPDRVRARRIILSLEPLPLEK